MVLLIASCCYVAGDPITVCMVVYCTPYYSINTGNFCANCQQAFYKMAYFGFSRMNNEIQAIESAEYFYRVVDNYFSLLIAHGNSDVIARLRSHFDSISMIYRQRLRNTGSRPDWSNGDYRRTYVYRFFRYALLPSLPQFAVIIGRFQIEASLEAQIFPSCMLHRWRTWIRRGWPDEVSSRQQTGSSAPF